MDRSTAEKISRLMLDVGAKLNESVAVIQEHGTADEFEHHREIVARVMGDVLLDIMNPIYAQYPEIKPLELD